MRSTVLHGTTVPASLVFLKGLPRFLARRGWQVGIWCSPGSELSRFCVCEGATAFPVVMAREINLLRDIVSVVQLANVFSRMRPEIVHAHTPKAGLVAMLACGLARVPVRIYHLHGFPFETQRGLKRLLLVWSDIVACALASRVIAVGHALASRAIEVGVCEKAKLRVLGFGSIGGVDAEVKFNPARFTDDQNRITKASLLIPEHGRVIGFVGRLAHDKGIADIALAWGLIASWHPNVYFVFVGGLDERDPVSANVMQRLRSDSRVRFSGEVGDVARYLRILEVMIFPSYREGFSVALLEAAAMAVPCIAYDIAACQESIVHGCTGTLVPLRKWSMIPAAVKNYLDSEGLRRMHGQNARDRVVRRFRPDVVWGELAEEYRAACEGELSRADIV